MGAFTWKHKNFKHFSSIPKKCSYLADINFGTVQISKYHAPEVSKTKDFSQESDVHSIGIVLIELLRGRSPLHFNGEHRKFVDWARHIAGDEWTVLVFDKGLVKNRLMKEGTWDMLAVALFCVDKKPEKRPKMNSCS